MNTSFNNLSLQCQNFIFLRIGRRILDPRLNWTKIAQPYSGCFSASVLESRKRRFFVLFTKNPFSLTSVPIFFSASDQKCWIVFCLVLFCFNPTPLNLENRNFNLFLTKSSFRHQGVGWIYAKFYEWIFCRCDKKLQPIGAEIMNSCGKEGCIQPNNEKSITNKNWLF